MNIRKMTLRELMIERIYMALSEEEVQELHLADEEDLKTISDEDFLEIYEEIFTY